MTTRQPAGVPTGGQFAPETRSRSAVSLNAGAPATMQTAEPLQRMAISPSGRAVRWLATSGPDELDVDPPYQRGHVWGVRRKQKLIHSIYRGTPIPSLVLNNRHRAGFTEPGYDVERNTVCAVVDGKQRISALAGFVNDEFPIPASWLPPESVEVTEETEDGPYVRFSGLSKSARSDFMMHPVSIVEARLASLAEEKELFDTVNFGGVEQGGSDLPLNGSGGPGDSRNSI